MIPEYLPYVQFFGQFALIGGAIFAGYQFMLHRRQREDSAALQVLTALQDADFRAAYAQVWELALGADPETIDKGSPELKAAVECVTMTFESLGVMVHNRIVPLDLVDQVIGGFLRESWRRLAPYVEWKRKKLGSRRWAEWYQWLAERMDLENRRTQGAYVAFRDWQA